MVTERIETLVIGAGQAGLATGYHLQRRGRPFLIVDADDRVGGGWRRQWDTLRLYSPAAYDALPGMPFPAPRWSYPVKDEVAAYLEAYADTFSLPVRLGVRVNSLRRAGGTYVAVCGDNRGVPKLSAVYQCADGTCHQRREARERTLQPRRVGTRAVAAGA